LVLHQIGCLDQGKLRSICYRASVSEMLVQEHVMGVSHQHWFNLRLDFDIDGAINAAKECEVKFLPPDSHDNAQGRAFMATHTILATEKDAARKMDFASKRNWVIYNPDKSPRSATRAALKFFPAPTQYRRCPNRALAKTSPLRRGTSG
jgi:Cu2+-containing amine oxidase